MGHLKMGHQDLKSCQWVLCLVLLLASASAAMAQKRVLIFTKTAGYRHKSIDVGSVILRSLGPKNGYTAVISGADSYISRTRLVNFDSIVLLSTTGWFLDSKQMATLQWFLNSGKGITAIHAAADAMNTTLAYRKMIGPLFVGHPNQQTATINVVKRYPHLVGNVPTNWRRFGEWYAYDKRPQDYFGSRAVILGRLDEKSYKPGPFTMGKDHPVMWCQRYGKSGRVWYTVLGHNSAEFQKDQTFLNHLVAGIKYGAGSVSRGPC